MSDDWLYVGPESDDYELSESYTLGGLCPVKLGDWVGSGTPPQYRIIYKLGFGSFSTVWLAHDRVERFGCLIYRKDHLDLIGFSRNVALKIVQAKSTALSQELNVLERLRAFNSTVGQELHVIQLLDSFKHTSANGIHQILVTEPVVPLLAPYSSSYAPFQPRVTKDVLRQTIEGLAYIHSHGIAHGGSPLFSSAHLLLTCT